MHITILKRRQNRVRKNIILFFMLYGVLLIRDVYSGPYMLRQIGPLFCYGQNILDKGDVRFREWPYYFRNTEHLFTFVSNQFFYALSDDWIVWMDLPVKIKNKGFGETGKLMLARFETEYAYHHIVSPEKRILVTVLGNCIIPTKFSIDNNPNPYTNTGSANFYLATTASVLNKDWYAYGSAGIQINASYHTKNFGHLFRLEWAIGRGIPTYSWNTYLMLEFSGVHLLTNTICKVKDVNSGGNIIYLGPSFIARSDHFYTWAGIQVAVLKELNGNQQQPSFRMAIMSAILF